MCDSSTVKLQDLIPADLVRRKYVGETYYSTYNPEHRWYYLSGQKPEEVTMLKIHDADKDAAVRCKYLDSTHWSCNRSSDRIHYS